MVEKNPALAIAGIQARYAAVEMIREEIRRLEAIARAEAELIRSDVESDYGLDMSVHLIAVARGMFDLDTNREAGAAEALSLVGDDGLFAAARNKLNPVNEAPTQEQQTRAECAPVKQPEPVEPSKAVQPSNLPSAQPGETLYGVPVKPENLEDARGIIVLAKKDAESGFSSGRYTESRGRYIWRRKLYAAAYAAFAVYPKVGERKPINQARPLVSRPEAVAVEPPPKVSESAQPPKGQMKSQDRKQQGSGPDPRPPLHVVQQAEHRVEANGIAPIATPGEPQVEPEVEQDISWPDEGSSDRVFGADDDVLIDQDDQGPAALEASGNEIELDDDLPPSLRWQDDPDPDPDPDPGSGVSMDERPRPPDGVYDGQGQYRESIAGNNLFDQQGQQDPAGPNFMTFGFGDNAYGLTRGQKRQRKF